MEEETSVSEAALPPRSVHKNPFAFIQAHFAVVSAAAIVCGIGFSTLFLFSYLSAFNWQLIWYVEYTDVIAFGLVAIGVMAVMVFVFNSFLFMALRVF